MSRKLLLIAVLAVALAVGVCETALAAAGLDVHAGLHGQGNCAACHNNSPTPALRGWAPMTAPAGGEQWYQQKIAGLCYGCHSDFGLTGSPSKMEFYAFHDNAHQFKATTSAPTEVDSAVGGAGVSESYVNTGLPYIRDSAGVQSDIDCTTCHNVHNNLYVPFSMNGVPAGSEYDFSPLCKRCHTGRENVATDAGAGLGVNNSFTDGGNAYSTHPTDIPIADLDNANAPTRFETVSTWMSRTTSVVAYNLGGKRADGTATGNMSCQTCHAVHGDEVANYRPAAPGTPLLAIPNVNVQPSNLCEGCHSSPNGTAYTTVGSGTDHPIDGSTGWVFYPPTFITTKGVPINWQQSTAPPDFTTNHFDWGATSFDPLQGGTALGTPACSSCHDAHGGLDATSLWYAPDNTVGIENDWCFNCHTGVNVVPEYHHSVKENWSLSQLGCGDCHGTYGGTSMNVSGTWAAHNGFYSFRVDLSPTDSAFCEDCHEPLNPVAFVPGAKDGASTYSGWVDDTTVLGTDIGGQPLFPAHHGPNTTAGTDSHPVKTTNVLNNLLRYAGNWTADFNPNGPYDVVRVPDHPVGVFSEWSGTDVLCESCHNILENVGNQALSNSTLTGGWEANLLLLAYEDDDAGLGAGELPDFMPNTADGTTTDPFCRVCHNYDSDSSGAGDGAGGYVHYPAAHTVESGLYTYGTQTPYGRTTSAIMTTIQTGSCPETTTADSAVAPGVFSYPIDEKVDCDSCHRAHNGWSADAAVGGGVTSHVIVQSPLTVTEPKTTPCTECHDVNVMCGY